MTTTTWSKELERGLAFQDADHQAVVELMNALQECSDAELPELFDQLYAHTREHLERENQLMQRINFFAIAMHKGEHDRVLAEMAEFKAKLHAGEIATVREYVQVTIPNWFLNHLLTMDTITAKFALQAGEQ